MKLGLSSYSLSEAIQNGRMTIIQAMEWGAEHGAEHMEIVPIGFDLIETPRLITEIREKADELNLELSNYAIWADFIGDGNVNWPQEVERVKQHVDISGALGIKKMRHDVAWRNGEQPAGADFIRDLPVITKACQEIADYAAPKGITTSLENHGFYIQASERIQSILKEVNRPNFKATLDVGNFLCVDEECIQGVKHLITNASIVHLKDFYYRKRENPGEGWLKTTGGNYLQGAIVGKGDVPITEIMRMAKEAGYDGYISVEFEGLERAEAGAKAGLESARMLWESVSA